MGYTSYNELIIQYRTFEDGEPVYNTCRINDEKGVLNAGSLLIVTTVILKPDGKKKIMENEKITEDDMIFLCLHQKSGKSFWIDGNLLRKADGEEAVIAVKKYDRERIKEEMFSVVGGGAIFTLIVTIAMILICGLIYENCNFGIEKLFALTLITTILGLAVTFAVGIANYSELKNEIQKRELKLQDGKK